MDRCPTCGIPAKIIRGENTSIVIPQLDEEVRVTLRDQGQLISDIQSLLQRYEVDKYERAREPSN